MTTSAMLLASVGRLEPVKGTVSWAVLLRAGQSLWSHALSAVPDAAKSSWETQRHGLGSRDRERPAGHLNRVWPGHNHNANSRSSRG